jgi:hypothetical protein
MSKVFSIEDFRRGLDTRRTPLTAPGGSLRILENAVVNPGGEIEKRHAFVWTTSSPMSPTPWCMIGQYLTLHVFACPTGPVIPAGTTPCPIVSHNLADPGETVVRYLDVETFGSSFYVVGQGASGTIYHWYNGAVVLNPDSSKATGTYVRTYKTKMYRAMGYNLGFSGVGDPSDLNPSSTAHPGAGFIETALNDPDAEPVIALEVFYNQMAVFSRLATQVWKLDPDPSLDELAQVLRTGTVAPHSVWQFSTGDILYLSDSGIRSLKTQTVNALAAVSDVGAALDMIIAPIVRLNPDLAAQARAVIQPMYGRYWLHINGTIYVLSYFPAGEITAWSTFTLPFIVNSFAVVGGNVAVQDTNGNLYFYGGPTRTEYDSTRVVVRTPHHDADKPTENKRIQSIDVTCEGPWSISVGMLPNNTNAFELAANINNNTFGLMSIPFAGYGTHFAVHMEHAAPGPALLAAIHVNTNPGVTK